MLPMNKIMEDVRTLADKQQKTADFESMDYGKREDEIAVFSHELSQKYKELVSVKLVKSLITAYLDSVSKDKDYKGICVHFYKDGKSCRIADQSPTGMCQVSAVCLAIDKVSHWGELGNEDCDRLEWIKEEFGDIVADSFEDLLDE